MVGVGNLFTLKTLLESKVAVKDHSTIICLGVFSPHKLLA